MRADRRDRGSLALELVILAPILLAFVGLVLTWGRYDQVTGALEATARDGARAATLARSEDDAQTRVDDLTTSDLEQTPPSCRDSATGTVVGGQFVPGDEVVVEIRCTVAYSDLGLFAVPGSTTLTRRFSSPLDPFRGIR